MSKFKLLVIFACTLSKSASAISLKYLLFVPTLTTAFNIMPDPLKINSDAFNKKPNLNLDLSGQHQNRHKNLNANEFISFSFDEDAHIRFVNFHDSKLIVGIKDETPFPELFASISRSSNPRYTEWDSEKKWILSFDYCRKVSLAEIKLILQDLAHNSFIAEEAYERCFKRILGLARSQA